MMKLSDLSVYDFQLPENLIAQRPAVPRDSARMLIYERGVQPSLKLRPAGKSHESGVIDSTFKHLPEFLDKNCILVCNDTKVIPARIKAKKQTGGIVEILFLEQVQKQLYKVLLSRFIRQGETLTLDGGLAVIVTGQEEKYFFVTHNLSYIQLIEYLNLYGTMPVPPYIDHPDKPSKLKEEYQTIFAKEYGSVAAPTASLHFTKRLLSRIERLGIRILYITLHVGLGTFAPLTEKSFETNSLHEETYHVSEDVWQQLVAAKKNDKKIVAAGTTSVRVLETIAKTGKLQGKTDLFITPGYEFKMVGGIITNFHLPKTSLLLLVSSFIGNREKTLELYNHAIKEQYRFYSFGDGMLIL